MKIISETRSEHQSRCTCVVFLVEGELQQTNQYVRKLLLIVYLSVLCVCQHTVDN
jgi:hypothetical protein